jgi:hypothetical protein
MMILILMVFTYSCSDGKDKLIMMEIIPTISMETQLN